MVNTLVDAQRALARLRGSEMVEASLAVDDLFSRHALTNHLRILDAALDAWQRQEWSRRRDADPEGWGLAVATDESPPSQPPFGGLRFQVTLVYAPLWKPEETWDDSLDPPLDVESYMSDICHCPGTVSYTHLTLPTTLTV